jgi:hypothetical protein
VTILLIVATLQLEAKVIATIRACIYYKRYNHHNDIPYPFPYPSSYLIIRIGQLVNLHKHIIYLTHLPLTWYHCNVAMETYTTRESKRKFQVICKFYIKQGWADNNHKGVPKNITPLQQIGMNEFGLTHDQCSTVLARAIYFMDKVGRCDLIRKGGRVNFPTRSDELVATLQSAAAA